MNIDLQKVLSLIPNFISVILGALVAGLIVRLDFWQVLIYSVIFVFTYILSLVLFQKLLQMISK